MDKKEVRHRVERSQVELDYWHARADQMRSVLNRLETDYLAHRTDCSLARRSRLGEAVNRALNAVAVLEGGGGVPGGVPNVGGTSPPSSGRSSPTESSSLLAAAQPSSFSTVMAADFSRNMSRLANRTKLKGNVYCGKQVVYCSLLIIENNPLANLNSGRPPGERSSFEAT